MRWMAIAGAGFVAGAAWLACWQQVQIVRLRDESERQRDRLKAAEESTAVLAAQVAADDRALGAARNARRIRIEDESVVPALARLRPLLQERAARLRDAREAAQALEIRDGSPAMAMALRDATADLDRLIVAMGGADLIPPAPVIAPAPMGPAPLVNPPFAPALQPEPTVLVQNFSPALPTVIPAAQPAAPAPAGPEFAPPAAPALVLVGGTPVRARHGRRVAAAATAVPPRRASAATSVQFFTASAGIPLTPSPLARVAVTGPLLRPSPRP